MTPNQLTWCTQALDRLNLNLASQGFSADRITYLNQNQPRFKRKFSHCLKKLDALTQNLLRDPQAYHWIEDMERTIATFLTYTNAYRQELLEGDSTTLAQTA